MAKEAVLVSGGPDSAVLAHDVLAHDVVARGADVVTVYRDNTPRFFDALSEAVSVDLGRQFAIRTPLLDREKSEVFARGAELGVDLGDTWSCTEGSEVHCGTCLACGCRQIAFRDAQLEDPTSYEALRSLDQVEGDFARLAADLAL